MMVSTERKRTLGKPSSRLKDDNKVDSKVQ